MLDFFDSVIEYIQLIFEWFQGFLVSSVRFFGLVYDAVDVPTTLIGYMPSIFASCIGAVVAVAVVKAIFGR